MNRRIDHSNGPAGGLRLDKDGNTLKKLRDKLSSTTFPSIEDAIREIDPHAPHITAQQVDDEIVEARCLVFPETTVTICCLTLKNGYNVIGTSACASEKRFEQKMGQQVAIQDARDKVWELLGFRLRDHLAGVSLDPSQRSENDVQCDCANQKPKQENPHDS